MGMSCITCIQSQIIIPSHSWLLSFISNNRGEWGFKSSSFCFSDEFMKWYPNIAHILTEFSQNIHTIHTHIPVIWGMLGKIPLVNYLKSKNTWLKITCEVNLASCRICRRQSKKEHVYMHNMRNVKNTEIFRMRKDNKIVLQLSLQEEKSLHKIKRAHKRMLQENPLRSEQQPSVSQTLKNELEQGTRNRERKYRQNKIKCVLTGSICSKVLPWTTWIVNHQHYINSIGFN